MKLPFTRAKSALFLTPLLFAVLVGVAWWQVRRPASSATPKNLIAVTIDPQLSGDGRLIAAGIQLRERVDVIDADGKKDYRDILVRFEARFWNAQTLAPLPSLPLLSTPGEVALSPDGSLVALRESEKGFRVVDLGTRKTLWSQSEAEFARAQSDESGMVTVLAPHGLSHPVFSPDGRTLAAWGTFIDTEKGTSQVTGFLFDARTGVQKASWKGAPGSRLNDPTLHFSPEGHLLASNELQPQVYLGNVPYARPEIRRANDGKLLRTLPFNGARVAAFGSDNRLLLLIGRSQYGTDVLEVDATTGRRVWSHTGAVKYGDGQLAAIDSAFYSADKKWVALHFWASRSVEILDARTGKLVQLLQAPADSGAAFAFSPDGKALLTMNQGVIGKLKINPLPRN